MTKEIWRKGGSRNIWKKSKHRAAQDRTKSGPKPTSWLLESNKIVNCKAYLELTKIGKNPKTVLTTTEAPPAINNAQWALQLLPQTFLKPLSRSSTPLWVITK